MIETYCGYVALVGRPNVGKSTLLNCLLDKKIAITSPKPQTTRHRILGIKTVGNRQALYVDTPGIHSNGKRALNRYMNQVARTVLWDVDILIFVVEALRWTQEDAEVLKLLSKVTCPVILAVNKIDLISDKAQLLPHLQKRSADFNYAAIVPVSAYSATRKRSETRRQQIDALQTEVANRLPASAHYFPEEHWTDRSPRFFVAEIIREKLMRILDKELPYALTIEIERFDTVGQAREIHAIIWVERAGQKPIVIGPKGERLKEVGIQARMDMEKLLHCSVFLQLWVKVRAGWSNDDRALLSLGYS